MPRTDENPFCTRRVRPGAFPFIFPPGETPETLVERLRENEWRGEIIGPHGSGKSALLAALLPAIEQAGRKPLLVVLHDGSSRQTPCAVRRLLQQSVPATLIIDGYEQLSRWNRWRLKRACQRRGLGLLITSHTSAGLPELWRTETTPQLAATIVAHLTSGRAAGLSDEEVPQSFARHGGNVREMLFDLYDLFERRRPT